MNKLRVSIGASALVLAVISPSSPAAVGTLGTPARASAPQASAHTKPDDVPAPPMSLLFGIGAIGLIWGRRLTAKKAQDEAAMKAG